MLGALQEEFSTGINELFFFFKVLHKSRPVSGGGGSAELTVSECTRSRCRNTAAILGRADLRGAPLGELLRGDTGEKSP